MRHWTTLTSLTDSDSNFKDSSNKKTESYHLKTGPMNLFNSSTHHISHPRKIPGISEGPKKTY
jgi:hypothetical protein